MADLAAWIEDHGRELIRIAAEALSQNAALQSQAVVAVESFFEAFLRAAQTYDPTPLYNVLVDWVEARSTPMDDDPASLMPVLAQLKAVTCQQILREANGDNATGLYVEADRIYTDALVFMAALEAEDLMLTARSELRKAEAQIQKLNKSKSDFIAIAAHELKTPLTIIEGYAGMIRTSESAETDEMLGQLSTGIESGVHRLRELVEDLVDVSVIELKLLKLNFQQVYLNHVIEALEQKIQVSISERNQTLLTEWNQLPDTPIVADPERLLQVLYKVASNAIKYTPDGGTITISGRVLPGFFDLTIADTGVGIAASRLGTIFDAFSSSGDVSLHSSGKVKFKGSGPGLGLPIAKGIIEAHGGSIWAQSPGYNEQKCPGSTFHIMIPLRAEPPEPLYSFSFFDTQDD